MPEWPEMEHYRRLLQEAVAGRGITGVHVTREKSVNVPVSDLVRRITGRRLHAVERKAKMLIFRLDGGENLLLHLMLGGAICCGTGYEKPNRTVQVTLSFGERHLYFIGLRLGYLHLCSGEELEERFRDLGPEPFDPGLDPERLADRLNRYRRPLKALLTDQSVIAGIGNCYSDELCFAAGIHPGRKPDALSPDDAVRLHRSMRTVLLEALDHGGYMEIPFTPQDRATGGHLPFLRVYDREGEPCPRCARPISRSEITGKKAFFCPNCQG